MTTVAAALIERGGKTLICRRRPDQSHAGKWEFPGGKVEGGESPAQALRRELREELGIEARVGPLVARCEYAYPGKKPILLMFFRVTEFSGEPDGAQFAEIRWERPRDFPGFDFLEGDVAFVRKLAAADAAATARRRGA